MIVVRCARPELAPFVERVWYYESRRVEARGIVLPTGRMQLVVSLETRAPLLVGVSTRPMTIETAPMQRMVGVLFRPGGASRFVAVPCLALEDQRVALDDLWGADSDELTGRLLEAPAPEAMLDIVERVLLRRARRAAAGEAMIAPAVEALRRGMSVAEVVERSGASRSRFVRCFGAHVGTTPKRYASLARFQRAVRALAAGNDDLAALALHCGYYDQAHFGHEFLRFAGRSPTAYRPRDRGEPNHVPE